MMKSCQAEAEAEAKARDTSKRETEQTRVVTAIYAAIFKL